MRDRHLLYPLFLLAAAFFFFPPKNIELSLLYHGLAFLFLSLFLSSQGKGMAHALGYLRLAPEKRKLPFLVLAGILTAAFSFALSFLFSAFLQSFGINDASAVQDKIKHLSFFGVVLAFTLAPLGEEAFFRGYLLRKLADKTGSFFLGAILSSMLFGAVHFAYGSVAEIAVAFAIGIFLCLATRLFNSLVPAIVAHSIFNLASLLLMLYL
ncbi:MAG: CPBP family intramembrane metalloprotease [Candidatus Micrarchaeota archaeon]|nr:CPBP family intramembrane metalloprotease [Candidatus Micrarchaeota archaeon]